MDVCKHDNFLNVRTSFSDTYDLIQIFTGIQEGLPTRNGPVDFRACALQRKDHIDMWHLDVVLSYATDEAAPVYLLEDHIGANHGYSGAVCVKTQGHDKTVQDIGSRWKDDKDIMWTLIRIPNAEQLIFLSENQGPSELDFWFCDTISGNLKYVSDGEHSSDIYVEQQQGHLQMQRSIRHERRALYYWKDGKRHMVTGYHPNCDKVSIDEEYIIYNPATVAEAICTNRPKDGYKEPPNLAVGTPMLRYCMTYSILPDGTVTCEFNHELLQDVYWERCMGIMHQEKCDVFGEGVWRYIPKLQPITDQNGNIYDFSKPYNTTLGPFPHNIPLTRNMWEREDAPPDRQIDIICGGEKQKSVAFATGYFPVYDGEPKKRADNITNAAVLVRTKKTYPTFANVESYVRPSEANGYRHLEQGLTTVHGVGYKKYFIPEETHSYYNVEYDGIIYHYLDCWDRANVEVEIPFSEESTLKVQESGGDLMWEIKNNHMRISGRKGYLVLAEVDELKERTFKSL